MSSSALKTRPLAPPPTSAMVSADSSPAFTRSVPRWNRVKRMFPGPATRTNTSSISRKPARSCPTVPVTVATRCSARSALRCASPPTSPANTSGWPSTCSSSVWKIPKARKPISPSPSHPPAARPTSPCSSRRRPIRKPVGKPPSSVTTSPGSGRTKTASCTPSTRNAVTSAWLPAPP